MPEPQDIMAGAPMGLGYTQAIGSGTGANGPWVTSPVNTWQSTPTFGTTIVSNTAASSFTASSVVN